MKQLSRRGEIVGKFKYILVGLVLSAFAGAASADLVVGACDIGGGVIGQICGNSPPVADAGGPYTVPLGSGVTLDGSGSSDPDGDPLSFAWFNASVFTLVATGATPTLTASDLASFFGGVGMYQLQLNVTDVTGAVDMDQTTLTITEAAGVPEPASLALLGIGLAGLAASRRRKTN